ncbi:hypothetical protein [uncultured Mediterranean phage uvMED]|nr:hypothetical protein [uncultured Mediterranean phage uvMED]BAR22560.1 hypothetical protein [uncultured Mediterranean phage uvMED]
MNKKKIEYFTKLAAVKERLPVGSVPLYLKAFPNADEKKVKAVIYGKAINAEILVNLEALAEAIETVNK